MAPQTTGITFSNHLADLSAASNQVRMNGSGVALGDFDGDGWCDIYFCGLESPNRLFRNLGNWRFEDVTDAAGVGCDGQYSTGAAWADVDGDGDLDLLVNGIGTGTRLFLNDGHGRFSAAVGSALARVSGSMSLAIADLDGDGDLDVYVVNYRTNTIRSTGYRMVVDGKGRINPLYKDQYEVNSAGRLIEFGEPDSLYLNDGKGGFTLASWTDGRFLDEQGQPLKKPPSDWGLSAIIRDFDGDGSPDIYVCNDFWSPDRLWLNDGHANFRAAPAQMLRHTSTSSMGVDVADIDRDGRDDFLVLDMLSPDHRRRMRQRAGVGLVANEPMRANSRPQIERNTLFWNRGDGTYAEIAPLAGLHASDWSWGAAFIDVDLDGFEDLLVTTGHLFDMLDDDLGKRIAAAPNRPLVERLLLASRLNTPCVAFRNRGDRTFEAMGDEWGFNSVGVSHGLALADLDNDGDLDIVVNSLNASAGVYRNLSAAPRVAVRILGKAPNTRGIGARLRLIGGPAPQSQTIGCGGRYLSSDDTLRVFAAGSLSNLMTLSVTWPDGSVSQVAEAPANTLWEVDESRAKKAPASSQDRPSAAAPLFEDVSDRLKHAHQPRAFDEFARQPLLSRRLDTLAPGVGWFDLDGDGRDDLIIGGGGDEFVRVFHNEGRGQFRPEGSTALPESSLGAEATSILGWQGLDGKRSLLIGASYYKGDPRGKSPVLQYQPELRPAVGPLPEWVGVPGPMAMADIDGDGDLDLFVGGRVVPGLYPKPATSALFRREPGGWVLDSLNSPAFDSIGLVSGAVFTDLDNDGDPDLVLACEWGPLRVWRNDSGRLVEATRELGLERFRGWWNGVTVGDFDGDGRMDLIASNWGRNSAYQRFLPQGIRAYFGDLGGRGQFEFVEAYKESPNGAWLPWRDRKTLLRSMPWLQERSASAADYASATLEEILGAPLPASPFLEVNWLDSTLFLNRTNHFEAISLPFEAQFSPAYGLCVGDLDGDGHEDLFLAQNFFGTEETVARQDGGRGLWLKGEGHGRLSPVGSLKSGLKIDGEQRGAALGDFDEDGRLDLVVAQHAGPTRLFLNRGAKPGLRLRLIGPPGNPDALGATARARTANGIGPSHELHAGSGYWSLDSAVCVITAEEPILSLILRFPWRAPIEVKAPSGAAELRIDSAGQVQVIR